MSTPMRKQYLEIKKRYPDAIVFFRLGDFYETFDEDAKMVSQICDIVLTSRPVSKGKRVPMAGVPHHAADGYIAKLIGAGHKVAIVEQVSDEPERGLMLRDVVRVITPGTVVEPTLLEEKRNNYLAALVFEAGPDMPEQKEGAAGIAYVDITTGEFATTQLDGDEVRKEVEEELSRLQPAECLVEEGEGFRPSVEGVHFTPYESWRFEVERAREALLAQFGASSLEGYGCEGLPLAISAAGAIVQYLEETQKAALEQLDGLRTYSTEAFMTLDSATRRNLELTQTIRTRSVQGSLLGVLDHTVTSMGGRLLRRWLSQPLLEIEKLNRRLDTVEALYSQGALRVELLSLLKGVRDLERLTGRVVQGITGPRDLLAVRMTLEVVPQIKENLAKFSLPPHHPLVELALDPCSEVAELIARVVAEDTPATLGAPGVIAPGFSPELDNLLAAAKEAKEWVASLERRERKRTGIKSLRVGYNKVFGYYIEVTRPNLHLVPEDYIRKQTLVNAERFITPDLKEYETRILIAQERRQELEAQLFRQVCQEVALYASRLLSTARALARLDVCTALAEMAARNNYVRPLLTAENEIDIIAGRHPVVELTQREEPFVPNDAHLASEEQIIVLTGPNMAGKSTYLRQVALIVLMAQMGSFVPADEARIGLVDRIFTRIGAQVEISAGQSTFMVEMLEMANILHHATDRSLLILDEIGRGTSTYDGISIAWAVVEYIHNHPRLRAKTLYATHYHELTELAQFLPRARNYNVAVAEEGDQVIFLRRVVPGGMDKSYGIHVAQLAGLPRAVIHRAQEILEELEEGVSRSPMRAPKAKQLPLLSLEHPLLEELKSLDVDSLSPIEALNRLYEWQKRLRGESTSQNSF
ncbi:MAG: DNA mismatch repair protein MutS [Anaerolineae bacterium]|nr:DNA mismatch repair protein MutS [Anaerolineae bacterium]